MKNGCQPLLPAVNFPIFESPADIPKDGSSFDLGMAVAILREAKRVPAQPEDNTVYIGELGLNGIIRPVRGIIGKLMAAKSAGKTMFVIPADNLAQARLVPGLVEQTQAHALRLLGVQRGRDKEEGERK